MAHHSHAGGAQYLAPPYPIFNAFREALSCRIDSELFWRKNGSAFAVEYSSCPIIESGAVQDDVVTFTDISARQQAEDALRQAHDLLELRMDERTQALLEALEQLRQLSAHTRSVREPDRTRIAREIHDELGSLLVALKMDVGWLDKRLGEQPQRSSDEAQSMRDRMRFKCQNMSRLIESAVNNVGRLITDLRPQHSGPPRPVGSA